MCSRTSIQYTGKKKPLHFSPIEKKTVKIENFLPYLMENKLKKHKPTEKLTGDQKQKKRYILHYRDTKFYMGHGIRVILIHPIYRFKPSLWLAKDNKKNTEQRMKAKSDLWKSFYKLLINSLCGYLTENIPKPLNTDLKDRSETHKNLNPRSKCSFYDKTAKYEKFNMFSFNKELFIL